MDGLDPWWGHALGSWPSPVSPPPPRVRPVKRRHVRTGRTRPDDLMFMVPRPLPLPAATATAAAEIDCLFSTVGDLIDLPPLQH